VKKIKISSARRVFSAGKKQEGPRVTGGTHDVPGQSTFFKKKCVTHRSQALNNNDDFNQRKKKTEIS
jgi:hypothetical protein